MVARSKISKTSYKTIDEGLRSYTIQIYNNMFFALVITAITATLSVSIPAISHSLFIIDPKDNLMGLTGLGQFMMILPILIALYFSFSIFKLSTPQALVVLWIYAASIGISISPISYVYTGTSIARTFFICASLFGGMSIYGYTTKRNLLSFGSFLVMGLWGIILVSFTNIFLQSPSIYFVESFIGICIFIGLIAVDTQKIKMIYYNAPEEEFSQKLSIIASLTLYLDIINLFLYALRFFGGYRKKRD